MDRTISEHTALRFEQLTIPHRSAAFNLAYWILRSREEAEDVVQDAYVRAFRAFSTFNGVSTKPWLLAIVRNAAHAALEARKRDRSIILLVDDFEVREGCPAIETASAAPSPEAQLIAGGEGQRLMQALSRLPLKHRDILVLREMEGFTYSEIAETTGLPIGTVMSRLSRARAELRKALVPCAARNGPEVV
jgi:RNA polymerase sigma-70 factor, ECF subfamily